MKVWVIIDEAFLLKPVIGVALTKRKANNLVKRYLASYDSCGQTMEYIVIKEVEVGKFYKPV